MLEQIYPKIKYINPFYLKGINKNYIINTAEGEEANEKYNNNIGSSDVESYRVIDQIRNYKKEGYFDLNCSCRSRIYQLHHLT